MKILVLTDFKVGSNKQAIALGESLSDNIIIKKIEYNCLIKIPNLIRYSLLGYKFKKNELNELLEIDPDLIIISGRRLSKLAIYLQKKSNQKINLIAVTNPEENFQYFSSVILPYHDKFKNDKYENIVNIQGALCKFDLEKMKKETEIIEQKLSKFNKPFISLIIGGDIKNKKYDPEEFGIFIANLSNLISKLNATLLITTSRRTSDQCIRAIKNNLNCNNYLYDWKSAQANPENINPYNAFINLSDILIMTGDSISMVSEVLTFGKSIYVYKPAKALEIKHIKFLNNLIEDEYIKEFNSEITSLEVFNDKKFNELERIKSEIITNLEKE